MPSISIIIPVFNESDLIQNVCYKLVSDLNKSEQISDFEIILVENGSSDNSPILIEELTKKNNRVIAFHLPNPDYGLALKTGIQNAKNEFIINFSVDFVDLNFLYEALYDIEKCDIVLGSYNIEFSDQRSIIRRIGSSVNNSLSSFILGEDVKGSHGFKLMKSKIAKQISEECYMTKDIFDDEMIYRMIKNKHKIIKKPLIFNEIRKPRSGIIKRGMRAFVLLIYLKLLIIFKYKASN